MPEKMLGLKFLINAAPVGVVAVQHLRTPLVEKGNKISEDRRPLVLGIERIESRAECDESARDRPENLRCCARFNVREEHLEINLQRRINVAETLIRTKRGVLDHHSARSVDLDGARLVDFARFVGVYLSQITCLKLMPCNFVQDLEIDLRKHGWNGG